MRINKILQQSELLSVPKVRLIARLKGDGSVFIAGKRRTNYYIKFYSKDFGELERFKKDIKTVYGLNVKESEKESGKKPGEMLKHYFIRSKLAFNDIMNYGPFGSYTWKVPDEIKNSKLELQREFLKTFSEDEGTVIIGNREVRIYSVNRFGLEELQVMLRNFGIESKIREGYGSGRNVFGIVIKNQNIKVFKERIGFLSDTKNAKLMRLLETLNS